jgi:hypothetical protein
VFESSTSSAVTAGRADREVRTGAVGEARNGLVGEVRDSETRAVRDSETKAVRDGVAGDRIRAGGAHP